MPRNPTAPPYKSKINLSRSEKTEKFMTTIPKPVAESTWDSWNVRKLKNNVIIWIPTGYEEIVRHLKAQWKKSFTKAYRKLSNRELLGLFIIANVKKNLKTTKAWKIETRELDANTTNPWMWKFVRDRPEYLIDVLHYGQKVVEELKSKTQEISLKDETIEIPPSFWNDNEIRISKVVDDAVKALLGNN